MHKPLKVTDTEYHWYAKRSGDSGHTEGAGSAHWLPAATFDRLTGGELLPIMGIRRYRTEAEAVAAYRKANG